MEEIGTSLVSQTATKADWVKLIHLVTWMATCSCCNVTLYLYGFVMSHVIACYTFPVTLTSVTIELAVATAAMQFVIKLFNKTLVKTASLAT